MKHHLYLSSLLAVSALFTACSGDDIAEEKTAGAADSLAHLTAFVTGDAPVARTTMEHTVGGVGNFFWTTGDKLWVDNDGSLVQDQSNNITSKSSSAIFYFSDNFTGSSYQVFYTGQNSASGNEVTIAANQTQSEPNNADHFATSGDCGTATATRNGGSFDFQLEHKAAYLCFLPRIEYPDTDYFLTKIKVTSDQPLAGTFAFDSNGLASAPSSGSSYSITLTTNGSGGAPGFPLSRVTSLSTNGSYMVIAPGIHNLTIRYYLIDKWGFTQFFDKTVSATFEANKVYDITAYIDAGLQQ